MALYSDSVEVDSHRFSNLSFCPMSRSPKISGKNISQRQILRGRVLKLQVYIAYYPVHRRCALATGACPTRGHLSPAPVNSLSKPWRQGPARSKGGPRARNRKSGADAASGQRRLARRLVRRSPRVARLLLALGVLPLGLPALREGAHEGGEGLGLLDRDARVERGAQPRTVAEGRQRAEAHLAREKGEERGSDARG